MAHMRLAKREITDGKELRSVIEKCTVLRIGGRDEEVPSLLHSSL